MTQRFASGLKSILRQDPDVILIGEIRDEETARIATDVMTRLNSDAADAMMEIGVAAATDVLPGMDARMATIEEAMPVLVEVQTSLKNLPENMAGLDSGLGRLEVLTVLVFVRFEVWRSVRWS